MQEKRLEGVKGLAEMRAVEWQCVEVSRKASECSLCLSPGFIHPLGKIKILLLPLLFAQFDSYEEVTRDPPQPPG